MSWLLAQKISHHRNKSLEFISSLFPAARNPYKGWTTWKTARPGQEAYSLPISLLCESYFVNPSGTLLLCLSELVTVEEDEMDQRPGLMERNIFRGL